MQIDIYNSYCHIKEIDKKEHNYLTELCSFYIQGFQYSDKYKEDIWDGKKHLYQYNKFPTGLIPYLWDKIKIKYIDKRIKPTINPFNPNLLHNLRDYQIEAIKICYKHARGIIELPTGSGKTLIFCSLIRLYNVSTIMLVHRSNLADQSIKIYNQLYGKNESIVAIGYKELEYTLQQNKYKFVATTFQSLHQLMKKYKSMKQIKMYGNLINQFSMLIIDEGHTLPASTFYPVVQSLYTTYYRYLFSGTPLSREDNKNLITIGAIGDVIFKKKIQILSDQRYLTPIKVKIIPIYYQYYKKIVDYQEIYKIFYTENTLINNQIINLSKIISYPSIIFCNTIEHCENIYNSLKNNINKNIKIVTGKVNRNERIEIIELTKNNKIDIIIATQVFNEGIDIPNLASIILCSGGKSVIQLLQRIGRGTRLYKNKQNIIIYDINVIGNIYTEAHNEKRKKEYKNQNIIIFE